MRTFNTLEPTYELFLKGKVERAERKNKCVMLLGVALGKIMNRLKGQIKQKLIIICGLKY